MVPIIPQSANNWLSSPNANAALGTFPYNLVGYIGEDLQREILTFINQNYAWPQVLERMSFEPMWDTILKMYRIKMDKVDLSIEEASKAGQQQKAENDESSSGPEVRVADSVVFDAIERLTNIHHFVSFKEGIPIQYNIPKYFDTSQRKTLSTILSGIKSKLRMLCLHWNFDNEDVYRKHEIVARHFYTYGVAFAVQ
jgi:hypothetical protein